MTKSIVIPETVESKIFLIRGKKVLLSSDLARLYGVEVKVLMQAVKRNLERFPGDFLFQLNPEESKSLRSQIVTLDNISGRGRYSKYQPYAFTEQGIAMLSSVLRSSRAIQINIAIMRTFVRLRQLIDTNKEIARKISQLERKYDHHDYQIQKVFDQIRDLPKLEEKQIKIKGFIKE